MDSKTLFDIEMEVAAVKKAVEGLDFLSTRSNPELQDVLSELEKELLKVRLIIKGLKKQCCESNGSVSHLDGWDLFEIYQFLEEEILRVKELEKALTGSTASPFWVAPLFVTNDLDVPTRLRNLSKELLTVKLIANEIEDLLPSMHQKPNLDSTLANLLGHLGSQMHNVRKSSDELKRLPVTPRFASYHANVEHKFPERLQTSASFTSLSASPRKYDFNTEMYNLENRITKIRTYVNNLKSKLRPESNNYISAYEPTPVDSEESELIEDYSEMSIPRQDQTGIVMKALDNVTREMLSTSGILDTIKNHRQLPAMMYDQPPTRRLLEPKPANNFTPANTEQLRRSQMDFLNLINGLDKDADTTKWLLYPPQYERQRFDRSQRYQQPQRTARTQNRERDYDGRRNLIRNNTNFSQAMPTDTRYGRGKRRDPFDIDELLESNRDLTRGNDDWDMDDEVTNPFPVDEKIKKDPGPRKWQDRISPVQYCPVHHKRVTGPKMAYNLVQSDENNNVANQFKKNDMNRFNDRFQHDDNYARNYVPQLEPRIKQEKTLGILNTNRARPRRDQEKSIKKVSLELPSGYRSPSSLSRNDSSEVRVFDSAKIAHDSPADVPHIAQEKIARSSMAEVPPHITEEMIPRVGGFDFQPVQNKLPLSYSEKPQFDYDNLVPKVVDSPGMAEYFPEKVDLQKKSHVTPDGLLGVTHEVMPRLFPDGTRKAMKPLPSNLVADEKESASSYLEQLKNITGIVKEVCQISKTGTQYVEVMKVLRELDKQMKTAREGLTELLSEKLPSAGSSSPVASRANSPKQKQFRNYTRFEVERGSRYLKHTCCSLAKQKDKTETAYYRMTRSPTSQSSSVSPLRQLRSQASSGDRRSKTYSERIMRNMDKLDKLEKEMELTYTTLSTLKSQLSQIEPSSRPPGSPLAVSYLLTAPTQVWWFMEERSNTSLPAGNKKKKSKTPDKSNKPKTPDKSTKPKEDARMASISFSDREDVKVFENFEKNKGRKPSRFRKSPKNKPSSGSDANSSEKPSGSGIISTGPSVSGISSTGPSVSGITSTGPSVSGITSTGPSVSGFASESRPTTNSDQSKSELLKIRRAMFNAKYEINVMKNKIKYQNLMDKQNLDMESKHKVGNIAKVLDDMIAAKDGMSYIMYKAIPHPPKAHLTNNDSKKMMLAELLELYEILVDAKDRLILINSDPDFEEPPKPSDSLSREESCDWLKPVVNELSDYMKSLMYVLERVSSFVYHLFDPSTRVPAAKNKALHSASIYSENWIEVDEAASRVEDKITKMYDLTKFSPPKVEPPPSKKKGKKGKKSEADKLRKRAAVLETQLNNSGGTEEELKLSLVKAAKLPSATEMYREMLSSHLSNTSLGGSVPSEASRNVDEKKLPHADATNGAIPPSTGPLAPASAKNQRNQVSSVDPNQSSTNQH